MAKRKYRRKGQRLSIWESLDWTLNPDTTRDIVAVILLLLGLITFLGMFNFAGSFGRFFIRESINGWGIIGYLIPFIFMGYGAALLMPNRFPLKPSSVIGAILSLIFVPAIFGSLGGGVAWASDIFSTAFWVRSPV